MANPMTVVSIVQAIINLALKIKEEVETFRHNREDCRKIGELVATVRDVAEGLRKTTEKEDGDALLGGALKALKQALERAWDVVVACQRKNAVLLALDAGAIAVKLRRVYLDVSLNLSAVVLANGAYNTSKLADINGIVAALRGDVVCNTMMLANILKIVAALPDALLHLQQQVARLVQSFSDASYYQNESIRETKKTDGYSTYSLSYAYPVAIQRLQSFSDSTNDNASYYQNKTTREIKKTNDVTRYSYSSSYNYPLAYPARQTSIQKSFSDSINVDPPCSSMGREGVVAGPAAEGSKSRPECINSSNPYHECSDYCLRKIAESRQRLDDELPDSWKRPPEQRTVHPDCINASNPYHECSDYCFRRIADAKSGLERGEGQPPAVVATVAGTSDAVEQQRAEDNNADQQEGADADDGYPQMTEKQKKLFELRLKMNEARKANQQAMVAEKKRMEPRGESRGVSKQKWLEDRKKKIGKLLDSNGLDMSKAYMLDTQETAETKYKKWEKEPAPYGWDVFNQKTLYDAYKKRTKNIEVDMEAYNKAKEADPEFYRDASSLQYGKVSNVPEENIDKMVKELKEREEKRKSFSRRRKFNEDKDIDSINDRNEHFNKKIERAFGKYTLEIKNNLERGTALPD